MPFASLSPDDVVRIVGRELDKLRRRPGIAARRIELDISIPARAALARRGFDAKDAVVAPLAVRLVADPEVVDSGRDRGIDHGCAPPGSPE